MDISQKGLDLIKQFEGCKLTAYKDQVGIWTIGYGTTAGVTEGMTISLDEAEKLLKDHVDMVAHHVSGYLKVPCNQNQFDALCSFAYNLGCSALKRSTLLAKFNSGDNQGAADEFLKWCMAGGKVNKGLQNRRKKERELFLS